MSPLRALAPDQRAVLELLLRQGRSYAELSEMLGLPEAGVRDRAHTALAALAPERVAPVGEDGAVADWILGQQENGEAAQTAAAVARMPAWRAWAVEVTDRLSEVDGAELPEVPDAEGREPSAPDAEGQEPSAPAARRPRPVRDAKKPAAPAPAPAPEPAAAAPSAGATITPRSSRLGGALVLGAIVLVVGVALVLLLTRDGDDPQTASSDGATPTATATATPEIVNEVPLKGIGNKSQGLMRVFRRDQDGKLVFALAADSVPKNKSQEVYAVWFTKKGGTPRNLGFAQTQVGDDNVFTTGGPQQGQEDDFAKWLADYDSVVVARAAANSANAKRPGQVILRGTLPGGQS